MSQSSIASYFHSRKRAATDEIKIGRNKVFVTSKESLLTGTESVNDCDVLFKIPTVECRVKITQNKNCNVPSIVHPPTEAEHSQLILQKDTYQNKEKISIPLVSSTTCSGQSCIETVNNKKRIVNKDGTLISQDKKPKLKQQKLVPFIKGGSLSPRKSISKTGSKTLFASKANIGNIEKGNSQNNFPSNNKGTQKEELQKLVKKELKFNDVKSKGTRIEKLQELKASLGRLKDLEKIRKQQEERNKQLRNGETIKKPCGVTLKEFKTIELEVLASPDKGLRTPTKTNVTQDGSTLMSPKPPTPKRILFSPSKDGSPSKLILEPPAYQKFLNLVDSGKPSLQLPFKYRCLLEIFKGVETVCAMFYNRKEAITFKKLKPAVQRMLRRNFYESHLAQIKHLFPDAYIFTQMKTRNYGSTSKQDYFQLVIVPNLMQKDKDTTGEEQTTKIDEDNVLKMAELSPMNPQVLLERQQKFMFLLLEKVKEEHEKFLKSLDPPLVIPIEKVIRWHPKFDLESCPNIPEGHIPQPPNVEKFSSAKDILSTARNLFNCATPLERAMERFEAKTEEEQKELLKSSQGLMKQPVTSSTKTELSDLTVNSKSGENPVSATNELLKGISPSLLEKIKKKQAARALDAMTRRPSQDKEATKYSQLPELSRHLRNVFVTERKGVLPLEIILKKIGNSFRMDLSPKETEEHLRLLEKECPDWIVFHEIRKTIYIKISREKDVRKIIEKLEKIANEKSK